MHRLDPFVRGLPKTDLHMHLEGSIEPEMLLTLAARNGVRLPWDTPEQVRAAYRFDNLQSFLDLYFAGCQVLVTGQDFYDITRAHLRQAVADGVVHAEMFLGPQSFTGRGVPLDALMEGILSAIDDAARADGITAGLLVSAHRHRSEAEAVALLDSVMPWAERILGIGMGGPEVGNPPSKFVQFFRTCRARGLRIVIHAGEEGPAAYVREAVELLGVDRIDHGNACLDDPALVRLLAERRIPLTVCPLSNLRLQVVPAMAAHPLRRLMEAGLFVTVNSDDPPYFGGYVTENLLACHDALGLTVAEMAQLARAGFAASFLPPEAVARGVAAVDAYVARYRADDSA